MRYRFDSGVLHGTSNIGQTKYTRGHLALTRESAEGGASSGVVLLHVLESKRKPIQHIPFILSVWERGEP